MSGTKDMTIVFNMLRQAEARIAMIVELFDQYASHDYCCSYWNGPGKQSCDCGFEKALKEVHSEGQK